MFVITNKYIYFVRKYKHYKTLKFLSHTLYLLPGHRFRIASPRS